MPTKSSSSDRPVITSGITIGAVTRPVNSVRPAKRPCRASASADTVPRPVASTADSAATRSDTQAAASNGASASSTPYHRVEKPPQTVTSAEALKE